jgi:DNA-binding response OmpR family regulator
VAEEKARDADGTFQAEKKKFDETYQFVIAPGLDMPGETGHDVLKWIRNRPTISTLPVVVVTSSNQDRDIHRAYLLGADGYLIKPGKPRELEVLVRAMKESWLSGGPAPGPCSSLAEFHARFASP